MHLPALTLVAVLLAHSLAHRVDSVPLETHGRWIIDSATGQRVKLRCVNWVGHMPAVVPEGLSRKPIKAIAMRVASLGFNCVRLTWATYLWTRDHTYEKLTVGRSLQSLGLNKALRGVSRHNPPMLGLTVREAYVEVVRALGEAGVMVVLDNHVSRPQWCCGRDDGNGFFGDLYFDVDEWVRGLKIVAKKFKGFSQVSTRMKDENQQI